MKLEWIWLFRPWGLEISIHLYLIVKNHDAWPGKTRVCTLCPKWPSNTCTDDKILPPEKWERQFRKSERLDKKMCECGITEYYYLKKIIPGICNKAKHIHHCLILFDISQPFLSSLSCWSCGYENGILCKSVLLLEIDYISADGFQLQHTCQTFSWTQPILFLDWN